MRMQPRVMFDQALETKKLGTALIRGIEQLKLSLGSQSLLVARLVALADRVEHQRLQLAVLGQFKRGKSTVVNALLGAPVLPAAVVPLTAIAIFIAWRAQPLVRIHFKDDRSPQQSSASEPDKIRDFLFRFVAEEANPEIGTDNAPRALISKIRKEAQNPNENDETQRNPPVPSIAFFGGVHNVLSIGGPA